MCVCVCVCTCVCTEIRRYCVCMCVRVCVCMCVGVQRYRDVFRIAEIVTFREVTGDRCMCECRNISLRNIDISYFA